MRTIASERVDDATDISCAVHLINTAGRVGAGQLHGSVTAAVNLKHCRAVIHLPLPRRPQNTWLVFGVVHADRLTLVSPSRGRRYSRISRSRLIGFSSVGYCQNGETRWWYRPRTCSAHLLQFNVICTFVVIVAQQQTRSQSLPLSLIKSIIDVFDCLQSVNWIVVWKAAATGCKSIKHSNTDCMYIKVQ